MAWSKLEDSFRDHRKFKRMARLLDIRKAEARGLLAGLWAWATTQAPDGDLSDFTRDEIEEAMDWDGAEGCAFLAAVEVELIDVDDDKQPLRLHDWMERAGSFRKAQQKQKERKTARKWRSGPVLYTLSRNDGAIKIGFTTDLKRRISEYRDGTSRFLCSFEGTEKTEKEIHEAAKGARIGNSEWFHPTLELKDAIGSVSRDSVATLERLGCFGVAGEKRGEERRREEKRGTEKRGEEPLAPHAQARTALIPATPPIICLISTKGDYPITAKNAEGWTVSYPGVDVFQELRSMREWCLSNPKKRKTPGGMRRFATAWLAREQNKGGSRQGQSQTKSAFRDVTEKLMREAAIEDERDARNAKG